MKNNSNRVKTHIEGFDELIEGGFPQGSNILISGSAGTGKTIFSIQFLYNGATKNNEKGIYFSFEEKKESLINQANQFGFDIEKLEKNNKLKMISIGSNDINKNTITDLIEIINTTKATRIVIDSITTLSFLTPESVQHGQINSFTIKKYLYSFLTKFKENPNITMIFISQKDEKISDDTARYLCDGVINIDYESLGGDFSRQLTITKMRKTKNNEDLHPMEISKNGIIIHNL